MYCQDCPRWNEENEQCRDGKVNPENWGMAVEVANAIGVRAICMFNPHREKLVGSRLRRLPVGEKERTK